MTRDDPGLEITSDPGVVWHIGYAPDIWTWAPWHYADDDGLFGGRWDDQQGQFRTLYTAQSLLACLLELLARFRPSTVLVDELDQVVDDDGTVDLFPQTPDGAIGYRWLDGRRFGSARQEGSYCFITHSRSIAVLLTDFPFAQYGLAAGDVDASVLKHAHNRVLTRSIARWLYDQHDEDRPLVNGVRFNSRHGDELDLWAVFERAGDPARSPQLQPSSTDVAVTPDVPEIQEVFRRFGLHWYEG